EGAPTSEVNLKDCSRARLLAGITVACAAFFDAPALSAQSQCAVNSRQTSAVTGSWRTPLDRRVSLHGRGLSLREALDRLSAAARFRVSYVAELLPLSRPVCLDYVNAPAGSILNDLLAGAAAEPVIVGSDQVVLAPVRTAAPTAAASPDVEPSTMLGKVELLDRVVVTGSAAGGSQRSLPIALDVVSGEQLAQRGSGMLSTALDGNVPGLWLWSQSPLSLLTRFGSIRGASSFGLSYPKIYVDGIEAANSLLVTQLEPEGVARIEVIRGPQGAALYGADAISGVINIITRQEGTEGGAPRAQVRSGGGAAASDYATGSVLSQSHSIALRRGTGIKSGRLGATFTTLGAFIPGASSQQVSANAGVRLVQSHMVLTGTARLFAQDAQTPQSPLLEGLTAPSLSSYRPPPDSGLHAALDSNDRQSVRQYTLGAMATFRAGDRWTHAVVAGLDGYTLRSATPLDGPFPSAADSALEAARGNAIRSTFRLSTVAQFGGSGRTSGSVTLAAEHSFVRDETEGDTPFSSSDRLVGTDGRLLPIVDTRSNAGLIAQASAAIDDAFFFSGGLRVEQNSGLSGIDDLAALPMLGIAWVRSFPAATVKLRTAYGRGIRPAQTSIRAGTLMGLTRSPFGTTLAPEEQSGLEGGIDIFVGSSMTFNLTGFNQLASGLIQPVSVAQTVSSGPGRRERVAYQLQNVGEITNRGVELQGSVNVRELTLGASASLVSSRVQKLASGYTGDLTVGDQMLEVPYSTLGANASWTTKRWFTAWSISRASDWVNYDRIALASAFADQTRPTMEFVGASLRSYWREYEGATRLGGNFGYNFGRGLTFFVGAENLLNKQNGEPDNITILPGRTITASLRASF
ncbi:MAG TPA: TonB-dependent receptor, partial [Gemmatimonadaceae bacterium]|nr:TonB-dependent receptor [Gemmatimonadaceae bacterium]